LINLQTLIEINQLIFVDHKTAEFNWWLKTHLFNTA